MVIEKSAGGVVIEGGKILIVLMKTITGDKVWTFPKGHIEDGETPQQAALREVMEECGVKCRIIDNKEFFINHYYFTRDGKKVSKTVFWYLMEPVEDIKVISTPFEIEKRMWVSLPQAFEFLNYESDKKMVEMLMLKMEEKDGI